MNEWIENISGECPVPERTRIDVKFRDGEILNNVPSLTTFNGRDTQAAFWRLDGGINDITHWRLHKPNKTLDDALGEQNTMYKMPFDVVHKFPETTYDPLPSKPSQSALVASIFNLLYPELSNVREVHIEALKDIEKLVRERGGE